MIETKLEDAITVVEWSMPGPVNILNEASVSAFSDALESSLSDNAVEGIIITSTKRDFIVGADLNMLLEYTEHAPETLLERNLQFKALLRKLESGGKPVVAALPGSALGGGYEVALACHRRIASSRPEARFGLPEVKLGLLPGGGGTQRLARLIGAREALQLMSEGKTLNPARAKAKGLIDEVVEPEQLLEAAFHWLKGKAATSNQPWDTPKYRIPGGDIQSPRGYETFIGGNALLRKQTWGNYPAPVAIASCIYHGLQMPLEQGCLYEARRFIELARSQTSRNMIRTFFFHLNDANKLARRPEEVPKQSYRKIGVLGAGMMGAGIAYQSASRGMDVVLIDTTQDKADTGKGYSSALAQKSAHQGRISPEEADLLVNRIQASTRFEDLDGCELVVEAVFEDRGVKAEVTRRAESILGEGAIFASNTSTLPISGLAEAALRPAQFIGLHFFSPVEKMPLVEVITGKQTSKATLARSLDFVQALGKTPIVVRDSRGFFTSRVFGTYVSEGLAMLLEGVEPSRIEHAGRCAGMPVGPLALADEVSLELMHRIARQTEEDLGPQFQPGPAAPVVTRMVELGRLGKKVDRGFYDYRKDGPKNLWPGLREAYPPSAEQPSPTELKERLLVIQAVETLRCMEEGVLSQPADADIGSILGWGFAAHTGGVISYIDTIGPSQVLRLCRRFEEAYGSRFAAPSILVERAKTGGTFHT